MKNSFSKPIGIVGGAGPMASAFLYSTIIELCQKQLGSNDYHEFPEIILESYPFIRGNPEKIKQDISLCFTKLQNAGAKLFCIASNSFHGFLPDVSAINFVSLISETVQETMRRKVSKALILAAQTTIDMKLYQQPHLQCGYPSETDQKVIQSLIREVAGGVVVEKQASLLRKIIQQSYQKTPFDGIIIACTELPLIHRKFPFANEIKLPIIDAVEILAKRLITLAK